MCAKSEKAGEPKRTIGVSCGRIGFGQISGNRKALLDRYQTMHITQLEDMVSENRTQ